MKAACFYRANPDGNGSTFGCTIPIAKEIELPLAPEIDFDVLVNNILVVDDDKAACRINARYLNGLAHNIP